MRLSTQVSSVLAEVEDVLRKCFDKQLFRPKEDDQIRLLRLRVWSERHKVSIEYILRVLVHHAEASLFLLLISFLPVCQLRRPAPAVLLLVPGCLLSLFHLWRKHACVGGLRLSNLYCPPCGARPRVRLVVRSWHPRCSAHVHCAPPLRASWARRLT